MPELPECEANRRRVEDGALNRTITGFSEGNVTHLDLPTPSERKRLEGRQFTEARRHGKLIFAGSATGPWISVHLGMTGWLDCVDGSFEPPNWGHFVICFEGDRRLVFHNRRKLGWMKVIDDPATYLDDTGVGPDAMEMGENAFVDMLGKSRGAIKAALMDQKKIAGIGNLYSDETLYQVGISPKAKGSDLDAATLKKVHSALCDVLDTLLAANDGGPVPKDWLRHRREAGAACGLCDGTIRKATVGGRTAFYCSEHQS
ncbi:DNA-formamidopyrimidine glycosylase family protein [Histidinibacterium lentulum]|uniref:DNA-formamidopyrimidine glycosylase n=1 Tax=Histidinibacterium lentulum TaxID=2480588 RepID=A0A3N2R5Y3_9RHOB|nr:DNA-formamidopyrimidine glycosylase family protein [Histidinibacterium lentulum]ROU02890.1 DNA-formamidopyrimidine glycosylase [Histidinibacterium lentulum]